VLCDTQAQKAVVVRFEHHTLRAAIDRGFKEIEKPSVIDVLPIGATGFTAGARRDRSPQAFRASVLGELVTISSKGLPDRHRKRWAS
jgi:hypothetical protein